MVYIGFDKTDLSQQKFYFDDSQVLTSNPPKYKVYYVDNEFDTDFVEVKNVFKLKPAPADKREKFGVQKSIKEETVIKAPETLTENITATTNENNTIKIEIPKIPESTVVEIQGTKKRGRPKKETKETTKVIEHVQIPVIQNKEPSKFEYKVITEELDNYESLENILNEYGKECWELCGFEIYKEGIFTKKSATILCVLKKRI